MISIAKIERNENMIVFWDLFLENNFHTILSPALQPMTAEIINDA